VIGAAGLSLVDLLRSEKYDVESAAVSVLGKLAEDRESPPIRLRRS